MTPASRSLGALGALPILVGGWLVVGTPSASAQDASACSDGIRAWVASCGDAEARVAACLPGHAIVAVGPGRLRVDVTRAPARAFVAAGPLGLSPVGEIGEWSEVPQRDRDAFDALVRCARARPGPVEESLVAIPSPSPRVGDAADEEISPVPWWPPWRCLLAALIATAVLVRRSGARTVARHAAPIAAVSVVVLVARWVLVPDAYFHQNGQGPFWIAHALGEPGAYGPGYAQTFSWIARRATDPDRGVFVAQALLASLVPAAAFAIARGVGASATVGAASALALALSPIHARLAAGESYFATCGSLLALAAAILAATVRSDGDGRARVAGSAAAGLLVAQAALIHPVCWVPAALLPGVVLVGEGAPAARLRATALATIVLGAVVLAAAGPDLVDVLRGPLGAQWLGSEHGTEVPGMPGGIVVLAIAGAIGSALAIVSPRLRRAGIALAVLGVVALASWRADVLGAAPPWVHHAYAWLSLGPGLAAIAALLRELEEQRGGRAGVLGAAAVVAASVAWHASTLPETTTIPTDAREAALVRSWREHLPEGAVVAYVERAGRQIVGLPLYDDRHVRMFADQRAPDLTAVGRDVFLYHSGLCTTERARSFCATLEAEYELEPLRRAVLPAIPSMRGLGYDRPEVEVVLYRVRDRRSDSTTPARSSARRDGR